MLKRFLIILSILLAAILIFQYLFLPIFLKHEKTQDKILEIISHETKGTVQFEKFSLGVFPSLSFKIKNFVYSSSDKEDAIQFKADYLKAHLELLPMLMRKIKLKDLVVKNANLEGQTRFFSQKIIPYRLQGFSIEARGIRKRSLGSFKAHGKLFSDTGFFEVTGSLRLGDLSRFKLEDVLCDLKIQLTQVPMEPILSRRLKFLPLTIAGGEVTGTVEFSKKKRIRKGEWSADLKLQNILYVDPNDPERVFEPSSQEWVSKGSWDVAAQELSIVSSKLTAEGLDGTLNGDFSVGEKGLKSFDAHVDFKKYNFDQARIHFPFLKYWFENGIEVDGEGEIRFQTRGNFDSFLFSGEFILDEASVQHAYFQKKKSVPLSLKANVNLENQVKWSGDFDFRYQEMRIKGSLLEFNLENDNLRLNFLTNKFHPTTFYEATASVNEKTFWNGEIKVLFNYNGRLGDPENAKISGVVNLDELAYGLKGLPFQTPPLTAVLKIDDTEIYSEDSYFSFGDAKAPFELKWKGWEAPRVSWRTTADVIDLNSLRITLDSEHMLTPPVAPEAVEREKDGLEGSQSVSTKEEAEKKDLDVLPAWLARLRALGEIQTNKVIIDGAVFEKVGGSMKMENGRWELGAIGGKGAGGEIWFEGDQDLRYQGVPRIRFHGKRLDARQFSTVKEFLDGDFSFKFYNVRDPKPTDIIRGNVLVHKGAFRNISLLNATSAAFKIKEDHPLTDFASLGLWLRQGEKNSYFDDVALLSKKVLFRGKGSETEAGLLDVQGKMVFDKALSLKWGKKLEGNQRLGIEASIGGTFREPRVNVNKKSAYPADERAFKKEISGKIDYLRYLERERPKQFKTPSKKQFLDASFVEKKKKKKRKGGFFEIFFGRR